MSTSSDSFDLRKDRRQSRILIIVDKYGWSYDTIARGIVDHARDADLAIDILSEKEDAGLIERRHDDYDLVFAMGWTSVFSKKKKTGYEDKLPFIDKTKLIAGIHSHRAWDDYRSTPDWSPEPPAALIDKLASLHGVNAVSRRLFRIFEEAGLDNLTLTENGVDTELFKPTEPINVDRSRPLLIGFSGSAGIQKHDDLKGLSAFILPLADLPNVEIRVLGERGPNQVPRDGMPSLYNSIDLYLCASTSEGFSQSVLEASACGRAVLSTRVGGSEDLIEAGVNGYFIERDLDQIRCRVKTLERNRTEVARLGARNRQRMLDRYSWHARVKDWIAFMRTNLPVHAV